MFRYVVTGGAGFLGSHLVDRLLADGHQVVAVDNLVTGAERNLSHLSKETRFEFVQADVSEGFPALGKVDGILHLASPASPVDFTGLALPILRVGSYGTFAGLEYAAEHKAWFLMASTSEVYGDPEIHPQPETYLGNVNPIGIRGVYDEAKRFSEAVTMAFYRRKKTATSIVRIFNTYGPRMRANDGRVVPSFIDQALSRQPLTVFGDGSQTRSFCFVSDLTEGLARVASRRPLGPLNLGNDREVTVRDVAETICRLCDVTASYEQCPLPEGDPKKRCPDISRARKLLEWSPTVSLEEGLKQTIDYFRSIQ